MATVNPLIQRVPLEDEVFAKMVYSEFNKTFNVSHVRCTMITVPLVEWYLVMNALQ